MPILCKQPEFFPDDLMELPTAVAPWEVAHLRSRHEKAVARVLLEEKKPFYLPQIEQTQRRGGRKFTSHLPLFGGYIFLRRVEGLQQALWRTNAVANLIKVPDQAQLTADLIQIRRLQASGAVLTPCPEFVPGDAVRVRDGVFSGYTGVVTEERGQLRLMVSVSMLQKSVSVEFPRELLSQVSAAEVHQSSSRARVRPPSHPVPSDRSSGMTF